MAKRPKRSAVLTLAWPAVAAVAPDELPMLEATAAAYLRRTGKDDGELLGFGLDGSLLVASMAVLSAAQAVLIFVGTIFVEEVREKSSDVVRAWIGRTISRWRAGRSNGVTDEPAEELPAAARKLSQEQLRRVWQIAYDKTCAAGMTAESATLVADAIVGRLAQAPEAVVSY